MQTQVFNGRKKVCCFNILAKESFEMCVKLQDWTWVLEGMWHSGQRVVFVIQKSRVQILLPVTRWICVWWSQIQSSTLCKYSQLVGQVSALPLIRKKKNWVTQYHSSQDSQNKRLSRIFLSSHTHADSNAQWKRKKEKQSSNLVVSGLLFPHSAWLNRALKYGAIDGSVTRTNRLFNTVLYISAQYSTVQYSSPVDLILVKEGRYHSTPLSLYAQSHRCY